MSDDEALVECIQRHKGPGPHSEADMLRWVANWQVAARMRALGLVPVDPDACVLDDDYAWRACTRDDNASPRPEASRTAREGKAAASLEERVTQRVTA